MILITGRLLEDIMRAKGMRRSDVVKALGYKNVNKGLRRLDNCIRGEGTCSRKLLYDLIAVLEIDREEIDETIRKTKEEVWLEKEEAVRRIEVLERENFKPYLYIKTEKSVPSQITIAGLTRVERWKHVSLPENIADMSMERQLDIIRSTIISHYKKSDGQVIFFGKITGYIYRKTYDESVEFSCNGDFLHVRLGKLQEGKCLATIGNKSVEIR